MILTVEKDGDKILEVGLGMLVELVMFKSCVPPRVLRGFCRLEYPFTVKVRPDHRLGETWPAGEKDVATEVVAEPPEDDWDD